MADPSSSAKGLFETYLPHLLELRKRVMISLVFFILIFGLCYYFAPHIYAFLLEPYKLAISGDAEKKLIYTGLTEAFFTYVKLAFWAAFCISMPLFLNQKLETLNDQKNCLNCEESNLHRTY